MKLVDVSKLQESLIIYDKALRTLPFATLSEVAAKLKLNVMDLQGKHSRINERRKAGGTQSYKIGKEFKEFEQIFGYEPSLIEPKDVVFITRENSQKYDDNELLVIGGSPVSNITKKHPMETKIVFGLTTSHAEDIVYSLFHAERDEDSNSPSGAFDGYFTKADKLIVSGAVNAARGNLAISGEFEITVIKAARTALRNKLKMQEYPSVARMIELLREDAFCPTLEVVTHEAIGRGSRLILQKVGNMDLAFNTQAATKFCQIRDIYPDPNEWQFWLQAGYDTRINDWHEKVYRMNEQKNEANDLAGDYCLTGAVQVNITGTDGGSWTVDGKTSTRSNGQYFIGLTAGKHTVTFKDVDGKTKPVNQEVTIKEGEVTTIEAQYT